MVKKLLEKEWDICIFVKKVVSLQRIMVVRTGIYRIKSWIKHQLTARNTGGHGIHSPYLFEWARLVMRDKNGYYAWRKIEECRARMLADKSEVAFVDYGSGKRTRSLENDANAGNLALRDKRRVCDIAKGSLARKKYAQMLSRLVNWLGHPLQTFPLEAPHDASAVERSARGGNGDGQLAVGNGLMIVELGTSLGITTAYMAAVDSRNRVVTYEGCPAVAKIAQANWKSLGIKNIECRVGEIDVEKLDAELEQVDVAFVDANHTYASTRAYINILLQKVHAKSVLVVDDIHHSAEMERAWREICADERVTSTMDLYQMGLVFFDKYYWKRHYVMKL